MRQFEHRFFYKISLQPESITNQSRFNPAIPEYIINTKPKGMITMSDNTKYLAIILIAIGILGLLTNSNIISRAYWNTIWPVGIIILGIAVYIYNRGNPHLSAADFIKKIIAGIIVAGTLLIVFLAVFGIVGPILALVAVIVAPLLLLKLGIAVMAVLIPIMVIFAPIILIIWLLSLLF